MTVKWSDIEAECGDFRAGFVATFRRYEGQPTDERDAYGRVVKVTVASFARHVGIEDSTFRRWVKMSTGMTTIPQAGLDATRARSAARRLSPADRAALAVELLDDPEVAAARPVRRRDPVVVTLDERWATWANLYTRTFMLGAELAELSEGQELSAPSALFAAAYARLVDRGLDAELEALLSGEVTDDAR